MEAEESEKNKRRANGTTMRQWIDALARRKRDGKWVSRGKASKRSGLELVRVCLYCEK